MEEDINYSTVAFKDGGQPPGEEKEEPTVYAEVKHKEPAATVSTGGGAAAARSRSVVLAACFVMLCLLVAASASAVIHLSVTLMDQRANLRNLTAENQQLTSDWRVLERETEKLRRVTENLNWTLGVILEFDNFRVNKYCPEKKCQPCKKGWIVFQEKCYLFYGESSWKTWEDSRLFCQTADSDLVVVDSLREQEFISNHTEFYFDKSHGYWLGLREQEDRNWVWVDGRNDTLSYWTKQELSTNSPYALMIPGRRPAASWNPADNDFRNKFICERDVLIRSD